MGTVWGEKSESGSSMHQIRGTARSFHSTGIIAELFQDLNQNAARREFCGPNKRIPQSVMEQFDKDIEHAKKTGDRVLKKELRRRHVGHILKPAMTTDVLAGKSSFSWARETTTSKMVSKRPMPRKFQEESLKSFACLTQHTRSSPKRATVL